ncbi:MAG TPA: BamA/TamA family outer membrane protein [Polyangiales bacterium]|nr:BamA/TamA family outer membrane protein [Polyangiales bacterium]
MALLSVRRLIAQNVPVLTRYCFVFAMLSSCATIPSGEYGVHDLSINGMQQLDDEALKVCLATQERERAGFTLGNAADPECGAPPFDASRLPIRLWAWPWTDWPVYDETVWNRDIARVARWFRARGYYDARVVSSSQTPNPEAHTVDLKLQVEENQPVLVHSIELRGESALDKRTRALLHDALQLHDGQIFDEALYDNTKQALIDVLRERAYALADVSGSVSLDPPRRIADVQFTLKPGRRFRFGELNVEGEGDLPIRPVLAAAQINRNEPFSVSALEDARRAIYELGPFASVEVLEKPRPNEPYVDVLFKVVPGRRLRTAIGAGMQVGTDPTLAPTDTANGSLTRWDLHLLGRIEHRNFLGGMRRISIEDRPRVIFDEAFPSAASPTMGNLLILDFRQPSFLEARTSFAVVGRWDLGRDPYTNDARSDLLAGAGPDRTFWDGKLRATVTYNINAYLPQGAPGDPGTPHIRYPAYYATYFQYSLVLDVRDAPREPKRGAYVALTVQHAPHFLPGDWDYVRVTPDVRGYFPLGFGLVLAARARLGVMEISDTSIPKPAAGYENENTWQKRLKGEAQTRLRELGPLRQRLRGGGNNSVRGYAPNTLGDVLNVGDIVDSGGLRQWEASLELRAPLTPDFGAVLFVDVGDVSAEKRFRWNVPQMSFGFGLRYRTVIGPIRLDFGFAPKGLQVIGSTDPRRRITLETGGRPFGESYILGSRGAIHFTIGEAY